VALGFFVVSFCDAYRAELELSLRYGSARLAGLYFWLAREPVKAVGDNGYITIEINLFSITIW